MALDGTLAGVLVQAQRHRDEGDEDHRQQRHGDHAGQAGEEVVAVD